MGKKTRRLLLALVAAVVMPFDAAANPVIEDLYWIDFEAVPAGPPAIGSGPFPRDVLSGIVFGSPQIEAGPDGGQVLVLDPIGRPGQLEQVELALGLGGPGAGVLGYGLELDVFIASLHPSEGFTSRFAVLLDDPSSRSVVLDGNGVIQQAPPLGFLGIGSYDPGEWIHLSLFVDFNSQAWTIGVNGKTLGGGSFDGADVTRARINLQSARSSDRVLVDNIHSWAVVVPEPGSLALGLAAAITLAWARRQHPAPSH